MNGDAIFQAVDNVAALVAFAIIAYSAIAVPILLLMVILLEIQKRVDKWTIGDAIKLLSLRALSRRR